MKILFLSGRILAGGFYIYSGIKHFLNLTQLAGFARTHGVPLPEIAVAGTGLLLFVAGFSFLSGYQPRIGVAAAVLFLIPVTAMMHAFWNLEGAARASNLVNFTKNVGLLGSALMFLLIPRPWPLSLGKKG
jgi:putative oxidoreductase